MPRNHAAAAVISFDAYYQSLGKTWTRRLLGPAEFEAYDDAWELMNRPASQAPWRMPDWVCDGLREHGREDVVKALRRPRRRR